MSLKNSKTLRKCEECNFTFSTETFSKNMTFKKTPQVKITSKSKVIRVCVF